MTPERWQQVKELFRSALEHEVEERAAFLERACDGDDGLRREVESLLASFEESDSSIETPVAEAAAELFSGDQSESLVGQRLGHYEVVSLHGCLRLHAGCADGASIRSFDVRHFFNHEQTKRGDTGEVFQCGVFEIR